MLECQGSSSLRPQTLLRGALEWGLGLQPPTPVQALVLYTSFPLMGPHSSPSPAPRFLASEPQLPFLVSCSVLTPKDWKTEKPLHEKEGGCLHSVICYAPASPTAVYMAVYPR